MSGVVQRAAPPPSYPPSRFNGVAEEAAPPPPPPDISPEEATAPRSPSSKEEVAKRNLAQDLLAKFMKQAASSSENTSQTSQVKRPREEEYLKPAVDPDNHFSGVHPSRRQRLLQAAPSRVQPSSPQRQKNPAAWQSNPSTQPVHQMNAGARPAPYQANPVSYGQPPQDPTNAHIFAGAGQLNYGPVSIPLEIFRPPPWTGSASKKFFFEVYAGTVKVNRFPIWTGKILVVGRQPDCNIVVHHGLVSRRHMVMLFHEDDGELMVYDLGSTHGSYLNDMSGVIPANDGLLPRKQYIKVKVGWRLMFGKCAYQYALTSDGPNPNWRAPAPAHQLQAAPAHQPRAAPAAPAHQPRAAPSPYQRDEDKREQPREQEYSELRGAARFLQNSNAVRNVADEYANFGTRSTN